ncbi:hypothetical protein GC197_01580 [bacterium]|nr:hypothetical protein [bacterium]
MAKTLATSLITVVSLLPMWIEPAWADGLLSSVASESRTDDPDPPKKKRKQKHSHCNDYDDNSLGSALAEFGIGLLLSPFMPNQTETVKTTVITTETVPQKAITPPGYFSQYPYQYQFGYMLIGDEWYGIGKTSSIRGSVEYGNDFHDLSRIGTKLLVEGTSRWGLDMQWDEYFENVATGGTDQLTLGDINATFRLGEGYHQQFRVGLGANYLHDGHGSECGINVTGGYDVYLGKPWIWSTEIDLGKVGSADLFRFRSTLGLQWKRAEIYAGYQYTNVEGIDLDGFVSGMRFWF